MGYYETLGVSKNASTDDIKKAFRKKAHELHPDKGGDAEQFKKVNEAYQVLGDEKKRAQFDQFGEAAFQNGGMGGSGGFGFDGMNINMDDLGDLGDVLGGMFGFGARGSGVGGRGRKRGSDVEVHLTIDFMEAVRGVTKDIHLRVLTACAACSGSGAEKGKTKTCTTCKGQGRVARTQRTPFGMIQTAAVCQDCHGHGSVPEQKCVACSGAGVMAENRTLAVQIPAGIGDRETIRLSGQGEAAPHGGGPGDLYVHIRVGSHPRFRRTENDVLSEEFVPLSVFLLGGTVNVETVDGAGELRVPNGTPSGTIFKLRGHGFPYLHGHGRGDHLVTLQPEIPKKLSREQKKLLEQLKEEGL